MKKINALMVSIASTFLTGCVDLNDVSKLTAEQIDSADQAAAAIKVPLDFPVPIYRNSNATQTTDTTIGADRTRSLILNSKDASASIGVFYEDWFKKHQWALRNKSVSDDLGIFLSAEKGKMTVNITCMRSQNAHSTTVTINVASKN